MIKVEVLANTRSNAQLLLCYLSQIGINDMVICEGELVHCNDNHTKSVGVCKAECIIDENLISKVKDVLVRNKKLYKSFRIYKLFMM